MENLNPSFENNKEELMQHPLNQSLQDDSGEFVMKLDEPLYLEELRKAKLEKGSYPAEIISITPFHQSGELTRIIVSFLVQDHTVFSQRDVKILHHYFLPVKKNLRTKYLLEQVLGRPYQKGMNVREMIGKKLIVEIDHNKTDDGDVYDNIVGIRLVDVEIE